MQLLRILALILGLFITFETLGSVVQTVIVPRATSSRISAVLAAAGVW